MNLLQVSNEFRLKDLLMGTEEWGFLIESGIRTFIMFVVILISLRLLGKRGVKQLSVFELVVIIGLGSAAGDPMFYKDVGILPALIVFILVVGLYKIVIFLVGKNKNLEVLIEGKPVCLIKHGVFSIENFKKEPLGEDEFFAELRLHGVSQLGQVEEAIVESSGNISVFYYADDEVKYGLSVMPGALNAYVTEITEGGYYSCVFCGYTAEATPVASKLCPGCSKNRWVKSTCKKRIA